MFVLNKLSLIILTRCDLKCRLCCEYVPQNKPFPDMTVPEAKQILAAAFTVADRIHTLHLTGGGEPFLHPQLPELVEAAMEYQNRFDTLMLFTNSTILPSARLREVLKDSGAKILVQVSRYGINPDREVEVIQALESCGVRLKIETYYGEHQSFGGWIDFGPWDARGRSPDDLEQTFRNCSVTKVLQGNWRTRDGRVHWCSRSQRGMELGLVSDTPEDYVDLLDNTITPEEKQEKFRKIAAKRYLTACDRCSGDFGTEDQQKRYPAAEQI